MERIHKPALLQELRDLLNLKTGGTVIDATLDGGGHTEMFLETVGSRGKVLGIDQDSEIVKLVKQRPNLKITLGNFRNIDKLASEAKFTEVDAILFDLGLSTWHLKYSGRGFSYQKLDEPLLMCFSGDSALAADILGRANLSELIDIFSEYGELKNAGGLAKSILAYRRGKRIVSVKDFLEAISIKDKKKLAKAFQALRIYVNDELGALREALPKSFNLLRAGGRLAAISYHSLEDREVKHFFLQKKLACEAEILTKKPVQASDGEQKSNPSSRSAKLRVLVKK